VGCRLPVRLVGLLLLLLLPLAGCKKKSPKVSSSSTRDASEPVIDEDYRFKLEWPGKPWKLVAEDEMRQLTPDAVAGVVSDSHYVAVIVESAPGATARDFAELVAENMTVEGKELSPIRPTPFAGKEAMSFEVRGRAGGLPMLFCARAFVHQDFAYQVLGWTSAGEDGGCSSFAPVFDAFSLLPGPVKARAVDTSIEDTSGVGWRVASGVFKDAATGIRVTPPPGWRLLVGDELAQINGDADVGLAYANPEVYMVLLSEVSYGDVDKLRAQLQADLAEVGVTKTDASLSYSVGGEPLEFRVLESTEGVPFEFIHGVRKRGNVATQVQAWYVTSNRDQARKVMPDAMAAIGSLSDAETAALAKELSGRGDPQNAVGAGWALRAGVYRDFEWGFQWKKPGPLWRARNGSSDDVNPRLEFEHRGLGLWGQVIVERSEESLEAVHEAAATSVFGAADHKPARVGDLPALQSDGTITFGELELSYRMISTSLPDDVVIRLDLWGAAETMAHPEDPAAAALAGLAPFAEASVSRTGGSYIDRRFGFVIPSTSGWSFDEQVPVEARAIATAPMWVGPAGSTVGVLALVTSGSTVTDDFLLDLLQQNMAEQLANQKEPETTTTTVAGVQARRLEWSRLAGKPMVVYLFQRGRTSYGIVLDRVEEEQQARFVKGFRFVD